MEIRYTKLFSKIIEDSLALAKSMSHEFVTPEHILTSLSTLPQFNEALAMLDVSGEKLNAEMNAYLSTLDKAPLPNEMPEMSYQFQMVVARAAMIADDVDKKKQHVITIPHIVEAIMGLKDSFAEYMLSSRIANKYMQLLSLLDETCKGDTINDLKSNLSVNVVEKHIGNAPIDNFDLSDLPDGINGQHLDDAKMLFVDNISEFYNDYPPIVGRTNELSRMIEAICRCDNNNIMLVGEHGVGKTAMIYALARHLREGKVPRRLKKINVYSIDLISLSSGTMYKGEIENRIRETIDNICNRDSLAIISLEGLHTLMLQNPNSDSAVDVGSLLNNYLSDSCISIIISLSYDEMSKSVHKNKTLMQRFQRIDINEPTEEETIEILTGIKIKYETYHKVEYTPEAIRSTVELSKKHIRDRFLPEKAIDLIDQTGARIEALKRRKKTIEAEDIAESLRVRYNIKAVGEKDEEALMQTLAERMKAKIYGQDDAIDTIVSAVQLWKSGLSDPDKPIANLLFVGPTGVGKTEVARTLAEEMGLPLQRFDMSEYVEKHTVAKLIGSPAGYIGYEDGGLLTEAIIKNPNCVLLLDEIEKAHADIFNVLLQVMDYGSLTDNRGQKANFQNVIIIMTSNAGAQYAHMASLGFGSRTTSGDAMLTEVKKTFKPEFINRLTGTVVFNEMDSHMANLIFDKKVSIFASRLATRQVQMHFTDEARKYLLAKGITKEYGAREIERVVSNVLKPLFVKEILFGKLKKGGIATVVLHGDTLSLEVKKSEKEVTIELSAPSGTHTPQKHTRKISPLKSSDQSGK